MIEIDFIWIGLFILIGIVIFLLHNFGGLNLFSNHDNKLIERFLTKFPLVSPEFYKKTQKEQTIENNQEIHEIRKELETIKEEIKQWKQDN